MSSEDFDVLPATDQKYGQYVKDYWNWLLSIDPDNNNDKDVFYMRAWYNYINVIQDFNLAQRVNIPDPSSKERVHRIGTEKNPHRVSTPRIFLAMLDTLVHDHYYDPDDGHSLSPAEMNTVLTKINDSIKTGNLNATIERIDSGKGAQPLVKDFLAQKIRPVPDTNPPATFDVVIPANSTLAGKMEFIQPEKTVKGRAQGFYALINIKTPGTYNIKSSGFGLRNYRAFMDYYINVPRV